MGRFGPVEGAVSKVEHAGQDSCDLDDPPWLTSDVVIRDGLADALSSRRFPHEPPNLQWEHVLGKQRAVSDRVGTTPGPWHDATVEALAALDGVEPTLLSDDGLAVAMFVLLHGGPRYGSSLTAPHATLLTRQHGVVRTVSAILRALHDVSLERPVIPNKGQRPFTIQATPDDDSGFLTYEAIPFEPVIALRNLLSTVPTAQFDECVALARGQGPDLTPFRRIVAALMVPDPELANQVGVDLIAGRVTLADALAPMAQVLAFLADDPTVIGWARARRGREVLPIHTPLYCATAVQEHGAEAATVLACFAGDTQPGDTLTRIGAPSAVAALAGVASMGKLQLA